MAGFAARTSFAGHASLGAKTAHELRFALDHPVGADHVADGDTGYGGLLNVDMTVKEYERAGASAIQLEDQVFPKKCGHTPNRPVVPTSPALSSL